MAKTKVDEWDTVPANNADIDGISILGTAPASNMDNALRELMAQIAATPLAETTADMRANLGGSVSGQAVFIGTPSEGRTALDVYSKAEAEAAAASAASAAASRGLAVVPGSRLVCYGDSWTAGNAASAVQYRYTTRLAAKFGLTEVNASVSGEASYRAVKKAYAAGSEMPKTNRRRDLVTWMAAFNDLYYGGSNAKTLTKIEGNLRAFIANAFLKTAVPANDASVTAVGAWGTYAGPDGGTSKASGLGGLERYTGTANDTLTWTFNGDNLVIFCHNTDGIAEVIQPFEVRVDGVLLETFNGNSRIDDIVIGGIGGSFNAEARVYRGLGAGPHSVEVKNSAAGYIYIDAFGTLLEPPLAGPLAVATVPKENAAGWLLGGGLWSAAAMDAADVAIRAVVAEFAGYPIAVVDVNERFDPLIHYSADNNHPNDAGMAALADSFADVVFAVPAPAERGANIVMSAAQSIPHAAYTALSFGDAHYDDDDIWTISAPTRITAKHSGSFVLDIHVTFAVNATGVRNMQVRKNNTTDTTLLNMTATGASEQTSLAITKEVFVEPGDYLEVRVQHSAGAALNVVAASCRVRVGRSK